jgi:putative RecB family exonuclease
MIDLFEGKILPWVDGQESDLNMSYSRLNVFENCPKRYDLYYNQHKHGLDESTIALEVGSICHKILELKAKAMMQHENVNYDRLKAYLNDGFVGSNVDDEDNILGIEAIKKKYGIETWYEPDSEFRNYDEKTSLFKNKVIYSEVCGNNGDESRWQTIACEERFDFIYAVQTDLGLKRTHFLGYIDRIDSRINDKGETEYRVIDYKTSKKAYSSKDTATALQMCIYGMYIYLKYGVLPVEYLYSFVLINETQTANTKGYEKRAIKKLDSLLTEIFMNTDKNEWNGKGTPLCYYCPYRVDSILKDPIVGEECDEYCIWTPDNKTFERVNSDSCRPTVNKSKRTLCF